MATNRRLPGVRPDDAYSIEMTFQGHRVKNPFGPWLESKQSSHHHDH